MRGSHGSGSGWNKREKEPTALGSTEGASSSSGTAATSAGKRTASPNKIRPPYWRLKREVKEEEGQEKVEVKKEEGAEESLPPPKYDPGKATDDLAHHLDRTQTPTSFVPQRHIMMVLGRPNRGAHLLGQSIRSLWF